MIKDSKVNSASDRILEEQVYEQVVKEISQGNKRDGLWGKALANSDGVEEKTKALYIKYRVQSIKDEQEISELIKQETALQEQKEIALDRQNRIEKCIKSLNSLAYSVKPKGSGWVIRETLGNKHKVETVEALELYEQEKKKIHNKEQMSPQTDKWLSNPENSNGDGFIDYSDPLLNSSNESQGIVALVFIVIVTVLLITIIILFTSGYPDPSIVEEKSPSADNLKSESYLGAMSDEFNKTLPKMVDKHIELTTTLGQYSHYTMVYRTANLTTEQVKEIGLIKGIKPETIALSCSNPIFRKLLDAGVLITAQYVAKDSEYIGKIDITKEDCFIGKGIGQTESEGIVKNKATSAQLVDEKVPTFEYINRISNEINKSLPMMVDKYTRLDSTIGKKGILEYHYNLLNTKSYDVNQSQLHSFTKRLKNKACSNPDTKSLLGRGISLSYVYYGNDDTFITKIIVTPEDCHSKPLATTDSYFTLVKLPKGVDVKIPKGWWVIGKDYERMIQTSLEAAMDLSEINIIKRDEINLIAANSMPRSTYAALRIDLMSTPSSTPSEILNLTNVELKHDGLLVEQFMEKVLAQQGNKLLDFYGVSVEKIGVHPAFVTRYRRSGLKGPVVVQINQVYTDNNEFRINLSYRESEKALWLAVIEKIRNSITIH